MLREIKYKIVHITIKYYELICHNLHFNEKNSIWMKEDGRERHWTNVTYQSDGRFLSIRKRYRVRPDTMAALMTNCVSEERSEVHIFTLFVCYACMSNRLKNKLEPGREDNLIYIKALIKEASANHYSSPE